MANYWQNRPGNEAVLVDDNRRGLNYGIINIRNFSLRVESPLTKPEAREIAAGRNSRRSRNGDDDRLEKPCDAQLPGRNSAW